ncbi:hypothetical protein SG34_010595 [Thalassomonas viridans]|uniref:Bacteriophage tail tape measure N-terminal domain-containing protein n=1 Tax=Thalassomonas viridans TaxID=137584 RepID=A0AAE9Z7A0_9GAMM|nr:hypothetical protein [Thalassomonas viridans]WDE07294.1 hypothetical protein SG34_010595 [Thalassomonas viridans]
MISGLKVSGAELKNFTDKTDKAGVAVKRTSKEVKGLKSAVSELKGVLATVGIGVLAKDMYDGIDAFQGYRAQLKSITGDWNAADVELARLIALAKETPFTLEQSIEGFTKLTNLGLDPSRRAMISYGNTAAAMGKDMMQMVEAVADASVGEFERLKEFGIKASKENDKVTFTFKGNATTIAKESGAIQEYLLNIGETDFSTSMSDQMTRLSAQSSNLGIAIDQLYNNIGNSGAADGFATVLTGMADGVDALNANLPAVLDGLATMALIVGVGGALAFGPALIKGMAVSMWEFATATAAAASSMSTLQKSASLLFAFFAGWEIGSYLQRTFDEVRVAGLEMTATLEKGFTYLTYAFDATATTIQHAWTATINLALETYDDFLSVISKGADFLGQDELVTQINEWRDATNELIEPQETLTDKLTGLAEARDKELAQIEFVTDYLVKHGKQLEKTTSTTTQYTAATAEASTATAKQLTENQKLLSSLGQEIGLLSMTAREKAIYARVSQLSADATQDEINAVTTLAGTLYDLELQQTATKEAAEKAAKEYTDIWDDALERVDEAFADGWLKTLEGDTTDVFDNIVGGFKQMLAEMLHLAITKPIVLNIQQSVTSMIPGMGGTGGVGNLLGMATNLSGGIGGSIMGLGSGIAGIGSTLGLGSLGAFGTGIGSTGAILGTQGIFGGMGTAMSNIGGLFSSGSIAGGIGAALPIVGMVAGAASIVDSLTGGSLFGTSYKVKDSGVDLSYDGGEFGGQYYTKKKKKKSFFRGSKTKYEYDDLEDNLVNQMNGVFDSVENSILSAAETFDITTVTKTVNTFWGDYFGAFDSNSRLYEEYANTVEQHTQTTTQSIEDYLNSFSSSTRLSLKDLSEEEASQAISDWMTNATDEMIAGVFPFIRGMAQENENLADTLSRVTIQTETVRSITEIVGNQFTLTGEEAAVAADELVGMVGGISALNQSMSFYTQEFLTADEQMAMLTDSLNQSFADIGQQLPATREEFKQLYSTLDLDSEANRELYASLTALLGPLDSYYDALEQQNGTVDELAQSEEQLAKARAEFTQSFADELARLDMSPLEQQLASLQEEFEGYLDEVEAVGAETALLEELYGRKRQAIIDDALAAINVNTQNQLDALASVFANWAASVQNVNNAIGGNILSIKRAGSDWNEADYQQGIIDDLTNQLGQGTAEEQLELISQLNDAITAKYAAEISSQQELFNLAEERYQIDLANYQRLLTAAESLKDTANQLRFGELSPLAVNEQFNLAKTDYYQLLSAAQAGDADAAGKLGAAGENYLSLASRLYGGTASAEYSALFNQITGTFDGFSVGNAPVSPDTSAYEQAIEALQQQQLDELTGLYALTEQLNQQVTAQYAQDVENVQAEAQAQINIVNAVNELGNDIANMPPPVVNVPAPVVNVTVEAPAPVVITQPAPKNDQLHQQMDTLIAATQESTAVNQAAAEAAEFRSAQSNAMRQAV